MRPSHKDLARIRPRSLAARLRRPYSRSSSSTSLSRAATSSSRQPSRPAMRSSIRRPRSRRARAPSRAPTALAVSAAAKFLESPHRQPLRRHQGLLRDPWSQSRTTLVIPRSPSCSRWPDFGVHVRPKWAFTWPIEVFTMLRFERSRCPDPAVHDGPISAERNWCPPKASWTAARSSGIHRRTSKTMTTWTFDSERQRP
jgi:hypothetical protein